MGVTAVEKLGKVSGEGVNVGKEGRILMKFSNVYDDKFENFHGHPDLSATTERVYYIFTREKEEKSEHTEEKKENLDVFFYELYYECIVKKALFVNMR